MIRRTAIIALLTTIAFGFGAIANVQAAEAKAKTACEKKADKKKISDAKKRAAYIKRCEKKKAGK